MKNCKTEPENMITGYLRQRQLIGWLGILLPFVCMAGASLIEGRGVQESVSMYYYTNMRDFFICLMAVVSLFLMTYRGYCPVDNIVTLAGGFSGLVLALFPCMQSSRSAGELAGIFMLEQGTSEYVHVTSAALFFMLLAFNSIFLFTRSNLEWKDFSFRKKLRNIVYVFCGITILAMLVLLTVLTLVKGPDYVSINKIPLKLEIIMLFAFGFSWLIKGEVMFRDVEVQL